MKRYSVLMLSTLILGVSALTHVKAEVNITAKLPVVEVTHNGETLQIQRNQDENNTINPEYAKTSRKCPPFCIQPMQLAPGVETVGELEVLQYLEKMSWEEPVLVIDSRTESWVKKGTIPSSININWTRLNLNAGGNSLDIEEILTEQFGVKQVDGLWDFSAAKTLILFCNGAWCGQSPANILSLIKLGYPAHKLKWYRAGMQGWESLGLTVVKP